MTNWLRLQRNYFLLALAFFTRVPIPSTTPYSAERLNHASRYFSSIGLLVGGVAAFVYWLGQFCWPAPLALLFSMLATLLLTGAFHEDGLADMCDGLGGGYTRERKLEIMKDSRLGSYGALAMIMSFLIKFMALWEISKLSAALPVIFVVCHTGSRMLAASLIFALPYVRDSDGKSKPLANNQTKADLFVLICIGLIPLIFLSFKAQLFLLVIWLLIFLWIKQLLRKQLGGYTGDCLGAAQQISEITGYVVLLGLLHQQISVISPWLFIG